MSHEQDHEYQEFASERVYSFCGMVRSLALRVGGYFYMPGPPDEYRELESLADVVARDPHDSTVEEIKTRLTDDPSHIIYPKL